MTDDNPRQPGEPMSLRELLGLFNDGDESMGATVCVTRTVCLPGGSFTVEHYDIIKVPKNNSADEFEIQICPATMR